MSDKNDLLKKPYGRFFLAFEAPGDKNNNDDANDDNANDDENVNIKARSRRSNAYTPVDVEDDTDTPDFSPDDTDDTQANAGDENQDTAPADDNGANEDTGDAPDATDNAPDDAGADAGDDTETIDASPDAGGEYSDDATDDQSPDFTDGADDDGTGGDDAGGDDLGTDDTGGDDTGDGGDDKQGPGIEYDSTRKYNLFLDFRDLGTAIDNYISKIEKSTSDDMEMNRNLETASKKMHEISDLCYDYMTIKFDASSYFQSLLFYQNLVIMIQMVFDFLKKTKKAQAKSKK